MTVEELIERLKDFHPKAEICAIDPSNGHYHKLVDLEEEYANLVTIGLMED